MAISVEGVEELKRDLLALGLDVEDPPTMEDVARLGVRLASEFAPKRTGRLARSIRPEHTKGRAAASTRLIYAGPINYGWPARRIRASEFMQRADPPWAIGAARLMETGINESINRRGLG